MMNPMINVACALLLGFAYVHLVTGAEPANLGEREFERKLHSIRNEQNEIGKHRRAKEMARDFCLTSHQIKAIAQSLGNDDARLEFATAAFPNTVDPENFYDVYDAFTTFSRVMRLHDRVRVVERPARRVVHGPRILDDEGFAGILDSLRRESFDNTRTELAKQIFTSSSSLFLSSQVKEIVDSFTFEQGKLEIAKLAYQYTFDKEKYHLVNACFSFTNSKEALSRHIEAWNKEHSARR